jgi:hypothetical protein
VSLYTYFLVAQALEHADLAELSLFRMRSQVLEVLQPQSDTVKAMYVKLRVATRSAEGDHQEMLATALRLAILCGAADPRDKAYGMFGLLRALASNDATLPYVDYAKPVAEVYEDMARALIRIGKSLWPLEIIARTPGVTALTSTKNLPSWVPDLQDPSAIDVDWRPALIRAVTSDRELNVPDHSKLHSKLKARIAERRGPGYKVTPEMVLPGTEAPGQLQVQVRHLAEVSQVYGRMPSAGRMGMPDGDALRTVCLSEWAAAALAGQDDDGVVPVESLAALESLTPALDYIRRRHSPAEAEDLSPSAAASRSGSRRRQDQHQPVSMYDGAALFRTTCGLLGLCKGDVRPGDRVWQLAGGRYPFVLRRELVSPKRSALTSWSARPRDKVYSLVGIADVCGLDAETRESAARWEKDHVEAHFHEITLV